MFSSNPFAELSASISPGVMQTYVVIMILLVVGGTLFDVIHKRSAKYFFDNWRNARNKGTRTVGGGEMVSPGGPNRCGGGPDIGRILQPAAQNRPPSNHVRLRCLPDRNRHHGVRVSDARHARARHRGGAVVPWGRAGLRWRLLVLVFHSSRRRRRGQFTFPCRARRPVHPVASRERDTGTDLGPGAGGRQLVDKRVPRFVPHRHDGAVRILSMVQVLAYVFQARGGVPETGGKRGRFEEQLAGPRRQTGSLWQRRPTASKLLISPSSVVDTGDSEQSCQHLSI